MAGSGSFSTIFPRARRDMLKMLHRLKVRNILLFTLGNFLIFVTSSLLFNFLTMETGMVWHDHFGLPQWDHSNWQPYIQGASLFYGALAAIGMTALHYFLCRIVRNGKLRIAVFSLAFVSCFLYIVLEISRTYIFEFGNTWTDNEIFLEIIFVSPIFTLGIIFLNVLAACWNLKNWKPRL